jgi:hypothetical protein
LIDDSDECSLSGSVWSEQSENSLLGDREAYLIKRQMVGIALGNIVYC